MSALTWIGVALLGGAGALLRVGVDGLSLRALTRRLSGPGVALAGGTFIVNISGAFVLGLLDGLALSGTAAILISTATLGAYTTFSSWMLQSATLARQGQRLAAVVNVLASLVIGFGAVELGRLIGTAL